MNRTLLSTPSTETKIPLGVFTPTGLVTLPSIDYHGKKLDLLQLSNLEDFLKRMSRESMRSLKLDQGFTLDVNVQSVSKNTDRPDKNGLWHNFTSDGKGVRLSVRVNRSSKIWAECILLVTYNGTRQSGFATPLANAAKEMIKGETVESSKVVPISTVEVESEVVPEKVDVDKGHDVLNELKPELLQLISFELIQKLDFKKLVRRDVFESAVTGIVQLLGLKATAEQVIHYQFRSNHFRSPTWNSEKYVHFTTTGLNVIGKNPTDFATGLTLNSVPNLDIRFKTQEPKVGEFAQLVTPPPPLEPTPVMSPTEELEYIEAEIETRHVTVQRLNREIEALRMDHKRVTYVIETAKAEAEAKTKAKEDAKAELVAMQARIAELQKLLTD